MTTLNPDDGHMVLINTFTVDPDKVDDLLAELIHASKSIVSGDWGCISANLHVSDDRKHVANYAQWRSPAHYTAFLDNPATKAHLGKAAGLAKSLDPIIYSLRATETTDGAG